MVIESLKNHGTQPERTLTVGHQTVVDQRRRAYQAVSEYLAMEVSLAIVQLRNGHIALMHAERDHLVVVIGDYIVF